MPVLIRASVDLTDGWAELRFPYDPGTITALKSVPGARWDAKLKLWRAPLNLIPVLRSKGLQIQETLVHERRLPISNWFSGKLRNYQLEGAQFLTRRRGALLTFDPRVGKTPTAIAAAFSMIEHGFANALLIVYPNSVRAEWETQVADWAGVELSCFHTTQPMPPEDFSLLSRERILIFGCHYEIFAQRYEEIRELLANRHFVLIADEIQMCKNRRIARTKNLLELANYTGAVGATGACVAAWGLTGTPQRNKPRDLWALFEFCGKGFAARGYWDFAKRYADAHQNDHGHWEDKGSTNEEELALRLSAISLRKTRQEVAAFLPKADFRVMVCPTTKIFDKSYQRMEEALADSAAMKSMLTGDGATGGEIILRELSSALAAAKIPFVIERAYEHAARGVKVLVFAHHHDTLNRLADAMDATKEADPELPVHFLAGGWMDAAKRRKVIEQWKACPGAAILLVNTQSSGVGIDLAEAETAIFVELEYVPADMQQAMDRIQDVHKGKRVTPPIYEFVVIKNTIDDAIAGVLLDKIRSQHAVVGLNEEARGLGDVLRNAGIVSNSKFGLIDKSATAVEAALASIIARIQQPDEPENANSIEEAGLLLSADISDSDPDEEDPGSEEEEISA